MKKLLIMALLFATQTNAQQITWQKYYNISTGINFCMSLLQLEDSGFIVASSWPQNPFIGRIFKTNKYGDTIQSVKTNTWCNIVKTHDQNFAYAGGSTLLGQGRLTKIDDSLNEMWTQYYPQFISISVTASNDSGFILNSSSSIIKTDSLGAVQWTGYFSGTIRRIIPCVNGDILVVGMYAGYNDTYKAKLFSATGQVLWERKHGMIPDDWGNILEFGINDAVELPDGNFLAACGSYHPHINDSSGWDMIKLDRLTGDTLQTYVYNTITGAPQQLIHMIYTKDSNIVVYWQGDLLKIKQDGSLLWKKFPPINEVWDMIGCNDNGIALAGSLYYQFNPIEKSTYAKLDSLGNIYNFQSVPELAINELRVFPNPASHQLTINHLQLTIGNPVTVTVYDVMGKVHLQQTQTAQGDIKVELNTLPSGLYLLQVQQADRLFTGRFVKE
jgi:hypothetical protein